MRRYLTFAVLAAVSCALAVPLRAAAQSSQQIIKPPAFFIYAYPGKTCPGGSRPYKGPEQALAAESGAVYCHFDHTVISIPKSKTGACPPGMKPHADAHAKPDADTIWCENDPAAKLTIAPPPPPPPQPPKPAAK